jgi:hypothetical protein
VSSFGCTSGSFPGVCADARPSRNNVAKGMVEIIVNEIFLTIYDARWMKERDENKNRDEKEKEKISVTYSSEKWLSPALTHLAVNEVLFSRPEIRGNHMLALKL